MKTFVITGGNSGLGYECAKNIAMTHKDNFVILACRNASKANAAIDLLVKETNNENIAFMELDLASLDSIRNFAAKFATSDYPPLYALVCNAGLILVDKTHYTQDGFEMTFGVNDIGHFLLTTMLLDKMADNGRIVFVSSATHDPAEKTGIAEPVYENARLLAYPTDEKQDKGMIKLGQRRYTTSKLCNIYLAYEFAERIKQQTDKHISVNAFNPGEMAGTDFSRTFPPIVKFIMKYVLPAVRLFRQPKDSVENSGKVLATLITDTRFNGITGRYFDGMQEKNSSELSYNKENRNDLWQTSVALTKLNESETILYLK